VRAFVRALSLARPHAGWVGVALVSLALAGSATVFAYNLVRPVYDEILSGRGPVGEVAPASEIAHTRVIRALDAVSGGARRWLQARVGDYRLAILALVALAIVVKNAFTFVGRYAVARLGLVTIRNLRNRIFDALLGQSPAYFHATTSATLVSRTVSDVQLINEALAERLGDLLQDALTLALLTVYVLSLNLRLALATLVLAPLLVAPVLHLSRRLRLRSRQSQEEMGAIASVLDETVKGIRVVQAFGMEGHEASRFRAATQRQYLANLRARAIQAATAPIMEVVGSVAAVALLGYASAQIAAGRMTLGDLSAFLLGAYGAYNPVKRLNKFNLALQQAEVAAERAFAVVDAPVAIRDQPHARDLDGIGEGVRLERVGFAYGDGEWVLRDLDLCIGRGETVALVGPSGAGKTTVAQLIPRFWDVQQGAVVVDGEDVRRLTLRSLRAHIALVTQETLLFNDTVRANITFGRPGIRQSDVERAAKAAFAHDFVCELPQGYDTVIGEGGARLSGGQRQRLAIARALFKDAPILILDEATSSLDPEAEAAVQRALANLMEGRTTLVIAHRLSTVRRADRIVVLDSGQVVEQGTHGGLMAAGGVYRRMVEMQELRDDGG